MWIWKINLKFFLLGPKLLLLMFDCITWQTPHIFGHWHYEAFWWSTYSNIPPPFSISHFDPRLHGGTWFMHTGQPNEDWLITGPESPPLASQWNRRQMLLHKVIFQGAGLLALASWPFTPTLLYIAGFQIPLLSHRTSESLSHLGSDAEVCNTVQHGPKFSVFYIY